MPFVPPAGIYRRVLSTVSLYQYLKQGCCAQGGSLLLETIILMSVFGLLGVAVLGAVQTSYFAKGKFDIQSTAENIARNQIDYVFEQDYREPIPSVEPYEPLPVLPDGFSVEAKALPHDDASNPNVSWVQVTVFKDGQEVKVFETLRANLNPSPPGN